MEKIADILIKDYGLKGQLTKMVAYQDLNYRLDTPDDQRFVVKITMNPSERDFVLSQNSIFLKLSGDQFPKLLPTRTGHHHVDIVISDIPRPLRVLHFIEGVFAGEIKPKPAFFTDFGRLLGQLDKELDSLDNPVLRCQSHEWDLSRFQELAHLMEFISDPELKRLIHYFFMMHREKVVPVFHHLPKGLIHGDANDWNVLVEDQNRIKGLIDFGDMVYSARVHEIGIALAYVLNKQENLVECAEKFVSSYHQAYALSEIEISTIYYLIAARISTSIIQAARKSHEQPESEYHQINAKSSQDLLRRWIRINPFQFENQLLMACGFSKNTDMLENPVEVKRKIDKRHRFISPAMSISYGEPIEMLGSALQYMYAGDGRTYLDCVNNIPHVGHCHPRIVEAGQKQMALLNTNTRYVYDSLNEYAEKLLAKFPVSLSKVFFVNSGSAATDLAVRIAKTHTGREKFLVLDHAYHGNVGSAIDLSPYKFNRKGGKGKPLNTEILGLKALGFRLKDNAEKSSKKVPTIPVFPEFPESPHSPYAAFIAESIPGCAGQVVLDKGFMLEQVSLIREAGGIYIADEVQNGFARVGKHFWGFELYDVVPDMIILGKPIANGHPMGAVVCSDALAKSFETGMEFFSSFGGNPVSCEIAKTVLEVIEEEGLQEHAERVGSFLLQELNSMTSFQLSILSVQKGLSGRKETKVLEVRGSGLFLGIELVKDLDDLEPDAEAASAIVNHMKVRGFLLSTDGPYENVIKFKPPMCFSMENAKELLKEFNLLKTEH